MSNTTIYPYGQGGELPSGYPIADDLKTDSAQQALSARQGVVLNERTMYPGYTITTPVVGKQTYGTVGNPINIGTLSGMEYVKITGTPTKIELVTIYASFPSSYIQYVDENDNVISLELTTYSQGTRYEIVPNYPEGAVAMYVNGKTGSVSAYGQKQETVKETLDARTIIHNIDQIVYDLNGSINQFKDSTYNNKLIRATNAAIGSPVSSTDSSGAFVLKIPITGIISVKYPVFVTTEGYGSVAIDGNGDVVWAKANTTFPNDTIITVDVNELNDAEYLLVGYISTMTNGITVINGISDDLINEYILEKMPTENYQGDSTTKVLNQKGAHEMYNLLLGGLSGGGLDCFNDFGVMPSCEYGDPDAFLADGTIDSNTARIKYVDVIAKYDALMAKYPNYITKTTAGYDASGTIEMYYYTFTPKYWKQSVYLQAGVHGWEPDPVFALAEIMYLVANAYGASGATTPFLGGNVPLKFLRGNVKFTIFPVVNPWGFNNRGDCGLDKRNVAQNNYNGVQLNGAWGGNESEAVMVRTLVSSLSSELSFAIDMHSTVWPDSRTRYGCFYGGVNQGADNVRTIYRTYEWLYQFYNVKYPLIVNGNQCPNPLGGGYASVGYMTNTFNSFFYSNYNIQASTMEFSDHTWTTNLHTSVAMSVAVNMYLNQIIQQLNDKYKENSETGIPSGDNYPAKG